jgi:hypothetical protein
MTTESTTPKRVMGTIIADPLLSLPVGAKVDFSSQLFTSDAPGGLTDIHNWDFFDGAVIGLHFGDPLNQLVLGSGVMVAPGVALAAKHVVESEMEAVMRGGAGFICTAIGSSGLMIWRPQHVALVDNTDLALLTLECASPLPKVLRNATISTRLPKVGERIFIAGVRHELEVEEESPGLNMRMMVAAGTVTERYTIGRDRVMYPWPVLEVDCHALHGMSGGPAFDERGFLIGLLSASTHAEPPGPAFVSLLWPALATRVTPSWPPGLYPAPVSLLEMDRKLCGIERPDALDVVREESNGSCKVAYRPWDDGDPA